MQVTGLFHVAIKTNDLDATVKFYTEVLGMKLVHRPDFGFPGAWIAAGDQVPIDPHLRRRAGAGRRQDALRHRQRSTTSASTIKGWDECLERGEEARLRLARRDRARTSLWQIFVHARAGVMMELTFDGKAESRPTPEIPADRVYLAGSRSASKR